MKIHNNLIAGAFLVLCSSVLIGAAASDDVVPFDTGKLTIANTSFDSGTYACAVSHWPAIVQPAAWQQPGFVAVIMKKDDRPPRSGAADPLVMCRSLAVQLQYNANNYSSYSPSYPIAVLINTMQALDQDYAAARTDAAFALNASIKAVAVLFGERYRDNSGNFLSTIISAKGVKEDDQANYLPGLTEIVTVDPSAWTYTLRLPESEDAADAPVVLWSPSK